MKQSYTKMHGLLNTFVVFKGPKRLQPDEVVQLCAANEVDGCLVVSSVAKQRIKMDYWNADGTVAEMCGNGLRCAVKFSILNHFAEPGLIAVDTKVGTLKAVQNKRESAMVEVQVGKARLGITNIIDGDTYQSVDVGNPHAVTVVDNVAEVEVNTAGPNIESAKEYAPKKTNVEFIEIVNSRKIKMRVWERGVGETQACGTGMVAAAAMAVENGLCSYPIEVEVTGGSARIWVDDEGFSRMLAPVVVMST